MEELLDLAKSGNEEAFTKIIISMKSELYGVARTRLDNEDDIEDAIQETMIIAFRRLKTLRKNKFYKTWFVKILINECNHIYRKRKIKNIFGFGDVEPEELSEEITNIDKFINDMSFEKLIEKLSYEEKLIFKLFYQNNYTVKEVAYVLDKKENTVKTIMKRSKEKIKQNYIGGDKK